MSGLLLIIDLSANQQALYKILDVIIFLEIG